MSIPSSSASVAATPRSSPSIKPALDLTSLRRRVAGAVGSEPSRRCGVDAVGREAVDQLGRLAALREADRAQPARHEPRHQERRFGERAGANAELGIEERRVPEDDVALRPGGRVALDDGRRAAGQRERELARVRDRGRGEQELRLGAVGPGQPAQAPEHVPDVRAEDAAIDVRLVDDDVAQVVEHVAPAVVVREDPDVQHVGVREDRVRRPSDLRAPLGLGIAVVDRGPQPGESELGEAARLILRQRLRRVEVQRPCGRITGDRIEDREVEGERLPGGRARRHDHVLATRGCLPRLGLMAKDARRRHGAARAARSLMSTSAGAARAGPRAAARYGETRAPRPRAGRPSGAPAPTPRDTGRTCARSGSCRAGRHRLARLAVGEQDHGRDRENAVARRRARGWRRCRA